MDGKGFLGTAFFVILIAVAVAIGMWLNRKYMS
jgi:uncharacterized membrane protein